MLCNNSVSVSPTLRPQRAEATDGMDSPGSARKINNPLGSKIYYGAIPSKQPTLISYLSKLGYFARTRATRCTLLSSGLASQDSSSRGGGKCQPRLGNCPVCTKVLRTIFLLSLPCFHDIGFQQVFCQRIRSGTRLSLLYPSKCVRTLGLRKIVLCFLFQF